MPAAHLWCHLSMVTSSHTQYPDPPFTPPPRTMINPTAPVSARAWSNVSIFSSAHDTRRSAMRARRMPNRVLSAGAPGEATVGYTHREMLTPTLAQIHTATTQIHTATRDRRRTYGLGLQVLDHDSHVRPQRYQDRRQVSKRRIALKLAKRLSQQLHIGVYTTRAEVRTTPHRRQPST